MSKKRKKGRKETKEKPNGDPTSIFERHTFSAHTLQTVTKQKRNNKKGKIKRSAPDVEWWWWWWRGVSVEGVDVRGRERARHCRRCHRRRRRRNENDNKHKKKCRPATLHRLRAVLCPRVLPPPLPTPLPHPVTPHSLLITCRRIFFFVCCTSGVDCVRQSTSTTDAPPPTPFSNPYPISCLVSLSIALYRVSLLSLCSPPCFAVPFHRRPTRRCVSTSSLVDIVIGRDPIRFRFYAHCFVFGFVLASNIVPYSANQLELWDSAS